MRLDDDGWRTALSEFVDLLRRQADLIAYAFGLRGWAADSALTSDGLSDDWPRRPNDQPRGTGGAWVAFEDPYAPDAFGVQLLGPGYRGRSFDDRAPHRWPRRGHS
jgi:hypothetical protein